MWVSSLGQEDFLEEGRATHSSVLAWRIPIDNEAWRATVYGVTKNQTCKEQLSTHQVSQQALRTDRWWYIMALQLDSRSLQRGCVAPTVLSILYALSIQWEAVG